MKALVLNGPWAYYERKTAECEARIAQLGSEVSHWRKAAEDAQASLAKVQQEKQQVLNFDVPMLREQSTRATDVINSLEKELAELGQRKDHEVAELTRQVHDLQEQVCR